VTETTAPEKPPEDAPKAEDPPKPEPRVGTPIWVWIVYGLGALAGSVFAFSLLLVALAALTAGGGSAGVNISMPALIVWLTFALAAFATFVWRRFGSGR
jgi:hypothetical protein